MSEPIIQEQGIGDIRLSRYCLRCHRKLKDPESMKMGFGPICAQKARQENSENTFAPRTAKRKIKRQA